jgi:hypothetical protein
MIERYPEQIPQQSFDNFYFSYAFAANAQTEIEKECESMLRRITAIVDSEKFFVQGFPVLKNIVSLQPSKDELKKLAKAADRLADLLDAFNAINTKLTVVKAVSENRSWFTSTFADLDKEIDHDLRSFVDSFDVD